MSNKKREKALKFGRWIENFLDPKFDRTDLMVKEAINILEVTYQYKNNDITQILIDYIKSTTPWENLRKNRKSPFLGDDWGWMDFWDEIRDYTDDHIKVAEIISSKLKIETRIEDDDEALREIEWALEEISQLLYLKFSALPSIFIRIFKENQSWEQSLFLSSDGSVDELIYNYSRLSNDISFKNLKMERQKIFNYTIYFDDCFSMFPWLTSLLHILIDFFENDGVEYFILCSYCNRFSVVKRRGLKKFCSDKCRYLHNYFLK